MADLFRNRTMWGMMLGFSGINYTAWLYLAWLPGYLQTSYNLVKKHRINGGDPVPDAILPTMGGQTALNWLR